MVTQTKIKVVCNQSGKCNNTSCMHSKEHNQTANCVNEICPIVGEVVNCYATIPACMPCWGLSNERI